MLARDAATFGAIESSILLYSPSAIGIGVLSNMSTDPIVAPDRNSSRYGAVLRISEALTVCREPEEFARALADQLDGFLQFDSLDLLVFKEDSTETEWHSWGKGPVPAPVPM